jgi:hypothetical protein
MVARHVDDPTPFLVGHLDVDQSVAPRTNELRIAKALGTASKASNVF